MDSSSSLSVGENVKETLRRANEQIEEVPSRIGPKPKGFDLLTLENNALKYSVIRIVELR